MTLRKRAFFAIDRLDDRVFDRSEKLWDRVPWDRLHQACCLALGHVPINDQCCNPAHDFCAYCQKSMPGAAR